MNKINLTTKYLFACVAIGLIFLSSKVVLAEDPKNNDPIRIKLTVANKNVIVKIHDNSASRQLIAQLPATFKFTDFGGKEKITELPKPISLTDVPHGMVASQGKMFIYVPWGNLGIFYQTGGYTLDKNLIELGEVESGLKYLQNQKNEFTAKMEILEKKP